jgi:hypothetical protein
MMVGELYSRKEQKLRLKEEALLELFQWQGLALKNSAEKRKGKKATVCVLEN